MAATLTVAIPVLDIDGLLKAKTDCREKDVLDKVMLRRLKAIQRD